LDEDNSGQQTWLQKLASLFSRRSHPQQTADVERGVRDLEEQGLLSTQDGEMIESLLEFGDTLAREVMVPRTEVKALAVDSPIAEIVKMVKDSGHTRFPVYEEDVDHAIGILHVKDLLAFWGQSEAPLREVLRPVFFVPETKKITDLLAEMRDQRTHMAVAIDEYGGVSGILTIEDIIEEIVGEIRDEHDDEEEDWLVRLSETEVLVDARVDVDEIAEAFGLEIPKNGYETVGGFISTLTGYVPAEGEEVEYGPLKFTVEEADERRIFKVRVSRVSPP